VFVLCMLSVVLSRQFPGSVMSGEVFRLGSFRLMLSLPLFWLMPLLAFVATASRIYNVRYVIDTRGVEARVGILSLNQRITRVRYEDIRSVETDQTLLGRLLDYGVLEISTAASDAVEVSLEGIAAPKEIQDLLQKEREARQRIRRRAAAPDDFQEKGVNM
jgi:uncharacterized membrane protein YdbT with pleckstrin-like domain